MINCTPNVFLRYNDFPIHLNYPSTIIAILSDNASASSIECVVKIIALFSFIFYINAHTYRLLLGSIPDVGSSKNIIFGYPKLAIAIDNRLLKH